MPRTAIRCGFCDKHDWYGELGTEMTAKGFRWTTSRVRQNQARNGAGPLKTAPQQKRSGM